MSVRLKSTLRIWTNVLSGEELADRFQRPDAETHNAGELMSPRNPRSQRRKSSSWHLTSDVAESATLSEHLGWATTTKRSLSQLPDDARADVFVGAFLDGSMGSFEISSSDAESLANCGLTVVFDVYGGDDEAEDAPMQQS